MFPIFRSLLDDKFNESKIIKIQLEISKYLQDFKGLYPKKRIIPKQHFLLHYPSAIRNFGLPSTYNCIKFEAKHSYFKRVVGAVHNRINLLKSLAIWHQYLCIQMDQ